MVRIGLCAAIVLSLGLAGCSLPRGAALKTEITRDANAAESDYAFYPVTRAALPAIEAWPDLDRETARSWPRASEGSVGRIITVGDTVNVRIWESSENSLLLTPGERQADLGIMSVSASGRIFIPYVGEVRIAGLSPDRARARIQSVLSTVAPSAQVQLSLAEGDINTARVAAGVASPGVYPLTNRNITVLNLLSQAGGVSPGLRNPRVKLQRGAQVYATALDRLYDTPALDALARPGDTIVVEEDDRYFLSLGAAGREDLVYFPHDHLTALEAISLIGGIADTRADPEGVLVLRQYPAHALSAGVQGPRRQRVVFSINLTEADGLFSAQNFEIMPGDVLLATESPVSSIQVALSLFGGGLGFARQLSDGT